MDGYNLLSCGQNSVKLSEGKICPDYGNIWSVVIRSWRAEFELNTWSITLSVWLLWAAYCVGLCLLQCSYHNKAQSSGWWWNQLTRYPDWSYLATHTNDATLLTLKSSAGYEGWRKLVVTASCRSWQMSSERDQQLEQMWAAHWPSPDCMIEEISV